MLSPWTWGLIAIALVTMGFSYRLPRAWAWLGLGGLDFFVTTIFKDLAPVPELHPFFTVGCDAFVCYLILNNWREDWELGVALAFLVSVFCSLTVLGGFVRQQWIYASLLELCNLAAMLWISATGIVEMIGQNERSAFHPLRHHLRHARNPV